MGFVLPFFMGGSRDKYDITDIIYKYVIVCNIKNMMSNLIIIMLVGDFSTSLKFRNLYFSWHGMIGCRPSRIRMSNTQRMERYHKKRLTHLTPSSMGHPLLSSLAQHHCSNG